MKCPSCGSPLGLEDVSCPYCGTPNEFAVQHQADMEHYREEYERTQGEVLQKASAMQSHGSWLAILAVLLVALVVGIILHVNSWDIGYGMRAGAVRASAAQDAAAMDAYLEKGDYGLFVGYYNAHDISLSDDCSYDVLERAAWNYVDLLVYVSDIDNPQAYSFREDRVSDTCGYIAYDLIGIFTASDSYSYDLDRYLPQDKRVYLDDISERAAVIAKAYFGLTDEEIAEIPNMSERRLAALIEERIAS